MRARGDSVTLMRVDRAAQQLGGREQLGEVGALGRSEFAGDDELLGGQLRREASNSWGAILTRPARSRGAPRSRHFD